MTHHAGANRISLDVSVTGKDVRLAVRETRTIATFPQCTASLVAPIDILHIPLPEMLHEQTGTLAPLRSEQQMDVVGHEHVGVHRARELRREFAEHSEVTPVVFLGVKTRNTVVAALNDVPGNARDTQSRSAGHKGFNIRVSVTGPSRETGSVPGCLRNRGLSPI